MERVTIVRLMVEGALLGTCEIQSLEVESRVGVEQSNGESISIYLCYFIPRYENRISVYFPNLHVVYICSPKSAFERMSKIRNRI